MAVCIGAAAANSGKECRMTRYDVVYVQGRGPRGSLSQRELLHKIAACLTSQIIVDGAAHCCKGQELWPACGHGVDC